jgi:hypothetical protein
VYETVALSALKVPPPLFVTAIAWLGGFAAPWVAPKLTLVDANAIAGACASTVKVTVTDRGLFVAAGAATATVAV